MIYCLDHLNYSYTDTSVLEIDHLGFEQGRIHALVGHNGAGKTSLLMLLAFLAAPTRGQILFSGQAVDSDAMRQRLRREVVLVPQHPIMFSTTVRANIEFGLKIRKVAAATRNAMVDEALAMVGLPQYKNAAAHKLSGGETQRVALARALVLAPQVLLCDEPTASVDAANQQVIAELLQRVNAEHATTIIFTTHDRAQAASLADNIVTLEQGRCADVAQKKR
ncbi:MAG: ATP-binding cassette domain-containing protein [Desulfovibrionales bacterium]|nr:ATP-binding cassette domain-containing protein [Desulfovibrionales bacterium]